MSDRKPVTVFGISGFLEGDTFHFPVIEKAFEYATEPTDLDRHPVITLGRMECRLCRRRCEFVLTEPRIQMPFTVNGWIAVLVPWRLGGMVVFCPLCRDLVQSACPRSHC